MADAGNQAPCRLLLLSLEERLEIVQRVQRGVEQGKISLGEAATILRTEYMGFSQRRFAEICKISEKTLVNLEKEHHEPSCATLRSVFERFGLTVGLVRRAIDHDSLRVRKELKNLGFWK